MKNTKKEEVQKALVLMLWKQDAKTRNEILNSIDHFLIKELNLKKEEIPWLSKKKDNFKGYLDFLSLLRLSYVKVFSEYYNRHHKRLH